MRIADAEWHLTEAAGKSTTIELVSRGEAASRLSRGKDKHKANSLLEMLDENAFTGASGVVLGLLGDCNNFITPVELTEDNNPLCCLPQTLGERSRTSPLNCDPRYDHSGQRWEIIGLRYDELCRTHDANIHGNLGHEPNQNRGKVNECLEQWLSLGSC